jgi:hypothetical protein
MLAQNCTPYFTKILTAPVVMGLDITAGIVHKASHLMEKSSNSSHDTNNVVENTAGSEAVVSSATVEKCHTNHIASDRDEIDNHSDKQTLISAANHVSNNW